MYNVFQCLASIIPYFINSLPLGHMLYHNLSHCNQKRVKQLDFGLILYSRCTTKYKYNGCTRPIKVEFYLYDNFRVVFLKRFFPFFLLL